MKISAKLVLKAAESGDLEYLTEIVNDNIDIEVTLSWMTEVDKKGRAPLHLACIYGHIHIVRVIWRVIVEYTHDSFKRADLLNITDKKGRTGLYHATANGHLMICTYLIERKVDLDICTNKNHKSPGSTALMASAENNQIDCCKKLIQKDADIVAMREDGADAIYLAARHGNHEIIREIATSSRFRLVINRKSFHGRNALVTAALHGHLEACKALVSNGFNLDDQDDDNFTALICASYEGHYRLVKWLVKSGANIYLKDRYGATAWDVAASKDFSKIAGFLREWQDNLERGKQANQRMREAVYRGIPILLMTYQDRKMGRIR